MKRSKIDYEITGPNSNMAHSKNYPTNRPKIFWYLKRKVELEKGLSMIILTKNRFLEIRIISAWIQVYLVCFLFSLSIALLYFESSYLQYEDSNLTPNLSPKKLHIYFARTDSIIGNAVIMMMQVGPLNIVINFNWFNVRSSIDF